MPRKFVKFLEGDNIYACAKCGSHLTSLSELISKAFTSPSGAAYLFNDVINVKFGKPETKPLNTGIHVIVSMYCNVCDSKRPIGWKYIRAEEPLQKYKEGKFILERAYLEKQSWIDK